MNRTSKFLTIAVGLGLAGCIVVPRRRGPVFVGPPVPVVVAPAPVVVAPPPPEVEVIPASPDPTYVWAPGYYFYDPYGVRRFHRGYWHHR